MLTNKVRNKHMLAKGRVPIHKLRPLFLKELVDTLNKLSLVVLDPCACKARQN